jgi:hypothetical protein
VYVVGECLNPTSQRDAGLRKIFRGSRPPFKFANTDKDMCLVGQIVDSNFATLRNNTANLYIQNSTHRLVASLRG